MNPILSGMATALASLAAIYIPRAYRIGKDKAKRKYGPAVSAWNTTDNANVELLLTRHAEELAKTLAAIEAAALIGTPLEEGLAALASRSASWAWVLSPALAMGMASGVDSARTQIAREEGLSPDEIGIIWYTAEDAKVCEKCLYMAGRWYDAHDAYALAAAIHPNCRCLESFDIGTPTDALVGPIPGYKPGTQQDIYRDLGGAARVRRARNVFARGTPAHYTRPKAAV